MSLLTLYRPICLKFNFFDVLVVLICLVDSHTLSPTLNVMSLPFAYFDWRACASRMLSIILDRTLSKRVAKSSANRSDGNVHRPVIVFIREGTVPCSGFEAPFAHPFADEMT